MNGELELTAEQRELSIPREFDVLEKAVAAQHIVIDDLTKRLDSITRPFPPDDQNAVKADAPNLTEFGGRLRHIADTVDMHTDLLRQIAELLEL